MGDQSKGYANPYAYLVKCVQGKGKGKKSQKLGYVIYGRSLIYFLSDKLSALHG